MALNDITSKGKAVEQSDGKDWNPPTKTITGKEKRRHTDIEAAAKSKRKQPFGQDEAEHQKEEEQPPRRKCKASVPAPAEIKNQSSKEEIVCSHRSSS